MTMDNNQTDGMSSQPSDTENEALQSQKADQQDISAQDSENIEKTIQNMEAKQPQESIHYNLPNELVTRASLVIDANRAAGQRIAVAESCTGGLVMAALTEVPGASDVFDAGFVTYANQAKIDLLNISQDVIETFGSVSLAVAWAMARNAVEKSDADIAVAITGIAGPTGGDERKPVGTVVFARARRDADPNEVVAEQKSFGDIGRSGIRLQAALSALSLLMPDASISQG
ncbi:nicotinamide-nucleotide amidase [Zymomonas mobilis]|uniref:Nicotinamide-nucleotide amidase n=2 Tax=Zymomonas mobilis TaxID=542 RepID=A0A542W1R3_ZYMMB|nr:nicotinamide-nucleotide amidase [Zymomonas mobilis]